MIFREVRIPSPVVACLTENNMARLLTAQTIAVLHHIFKYIFIADLGLLVMKSNFVACLVQTNIGHDGGNDHIILELSDLFEIFTTHIEDQVSIDHISIFIYCQATVCVSVISESYIQPFFFYKCRSPSIWVDPQSRLMLVPSGSLLIT